MAHEILLQQIVEKLNNVRGLKAIVLGGSYASNTQRPDSDLDIGLYYAADNPLDIEQVRAIARELHDFPDPIVTDLGGWGTWVNGGAWLTIQGQRLDFLYRDLSFVTATLDDCCNGKVISDYWQQPAYGFHNFMYCTETKICRPLYDPEHVIDVLKAKIAVYPPLLKRAISQNFLWDARFTHENTFKAVARGEVYRVTGAWTRTIHCLVQVLYALNERYYLSEKRLAEDINSFSIKPDNFLERIYHLLGATGTSSSQLQASQIAVQALYDEVAILVKRELTATISHV
ncbi:hypothetical protein KDA_65020 [Dictyobacter alpinus]|uniref:Polymerase beta nucleotidyltransferase domain-containing protein n=1 Tax=Dictyobacter alpinus TaxID=2014873 RepID=A0A402BHY3_9CHLR|nr:nucleotidyltransferase domain-containing protein [Dictyobacter alpinus]GCE31018.1 hypothetical protein KDA_65020 [Dictyobacter alpinus]